MGSMLTDDARCALEFRYGIAMARAAFDNKKT
jgi:hypothetical protein